jgi:hypothetical protein
MLELDADTIKQLRVIIAHNDSHPHCKVSARKTVELLQSRGYQCSRDKLNSICVKLLGRKSFSNA